MREPLRTVSMGLLSAVLLCLLPGVQPGEAQVVRAPTDPGVLPADLPPWIRGLRDDVESILPRSRWPTARWGLLAVSLDRGDTLVAADPDALLAPASNVKLLTSAAAMDALDPGFHYTTYLLGAGPIQDGVLRGDLILMGTGDPTLTDRPRGARPAPFDVLARRLRDLGVRRVDGDVVGDASLFHGPERAPGWNPADFNRSFSVPAAALAYRDNVVTVVVTPGRSAGGRPTLRLQPEGSALDLVNEARTVSGAPRRTLQLVRGRGDESVRVIGEVRAGAGDRHLTITVGDPVLHVASILRTTLENHGIAVVGRAVAVRDPLASHVTGARRWAPAFGRPAPRVLAEVHSAPMGEILRIVNQRSHNLYADMVSLTLGRVIEGDGSFEGGARAVARFAHRAGVPEGHVALVDGSGLSRDNQATAGSFISVLRSMAAGPHWSAYLETLPEAGGNALRRMQRSAAAGNLRAKTGTIQNVSALSGVVRSSDGEAVLFSILANGVPNTWQAKDLEDRIGIRLAGTTRPLLASPEVLMPRMDSVEVRRGSDRNDEQGGSDLR